MIQSLSQRIKPGGFLADVAAGLSAPQKTLPCKYFYDPRGSRLFDRICELEEYYPTRTELAILRHHCDAIVEACGENAALIEPGSGSSTKTRLLLRHQAAWSSYTPMDISAEYLAEVAETLRAEFPWLDVLPVASDFTAAAGIDWDSLLPEHRHRVVFFPGSTIGNFTPSQAKRLLDRFAGWAGRGGGLLIGIDLQKDPAVLEAAYDDRDGVTAAFNLNLLHRINRELAADFRVESFRHGARYDAVHHRIEMSLVSTCPQTVRCGRHRWDFGRGERIVTEHSHKYTVDGFEAMAAECGLVRREVWTDPQGYFAVMLLCVR